MSFLRLLVLCSIFNSAALNAVEFSTKVLKSYLIKISKTPHPMGSAAQQNIGNFIAKTMKSHGYKVSLQKFTATTPNKNYPPMTRDIPGINIIAYDKGKLGCLNIIASHYDSKNIENFIGANDPGSSSAGLLLLSRKLKGQRSANGCSFAFIFFDGEEATLDGWNDSQRFHPSGIVDNTYGSRYMAQHLKPCQNSFYCLPNTSARIENVILLDMIGANNIKLSKDVNSSLSLRTKIQALDEQYFKGELYKNSYLTSIADDHLAFCKLGIPCLNIIDFNNIENWHKSSDTLVNVNLSSIKKVLKLSYYLSLNL